MTYLSSVILFLLISWLDGFQLGFISPKWNGANWQMGIADGKSVASEIKQKIDPSDLNEKFDKPAPIYSNKAPLFRQIRKRSKYIGSFKYNKNSGKEFKSRLPRKRKFVKRQRMQQLAEEIAFSRDINKNAVEMEDNSLLPLVEAIAFAAEKRKSDYIHVMKVFSLTEVTSIMVVIEGNNKPQNQAIALAIEEDLVAKYGKVPFAKTGHAGGGWVVLDYGSVIAHIMTPQLRKYYQLERRWGKAEVMDVNYLFPNRPNALRNGNGESIHPSESIPEEVLTDDLLVSDPNDAFWS